ncbi:hypothetical protein LTR08_004415 [Meristemomyces frigidus]|nr:hypothetical protein LTR08_004415 [Meristemomyces frigidus]
MSKMIWDVNTDAKLMAAVFTECDLKFTQQNYEALSKVMGCTPKAIKHRVTKIRNAGKESSGAEGGGASKAVKATKTTKAAPGGNKKAIGVGKARGARTPSPGGGDEEVDAASTPLPSDRPKRGGVKRNYAQLAGEDEDDVEEEEGLGKKIKVEVDEDIGQGSGQADEVEVDEDIGQGPEQADEVDDEVELDGAGFFT